MGAVRPDIYYSVDVEADGPVPGRYSMLSIGLVVAGVFDGTTYQPADLETTFYRELAPISTDFEPEALSVSGLDRDRLTAEGTDPAAAMRDLTEWVEQTAQGRKPILVAYPVAFDWMYLYWYLRVFGERSPFGHSGCLDIRMVYATRAGVPFGRAYRKNMPPELLPARPHTHHALDDAREQAELFSNLMLWPGPTGGHATTSPRRPESAHA